MEDIEIDEDALCPSAPSSNTWDPTLLPELNDTADITERISQARKLFTAP
jgi:hypothetical protein